MTADHPTAAETAEMARYALAELERLQKLSTAGASPEEAAQIAEEIRFEVAMFHPLRDMMTSLAAGTFDAAEHGYALASMVYQGAGHKARFMSENAE